MSIYDNIWNDKISFINNILELEQNISPKMKLYYLYRKKMEFSINNIVYEKFLLRYHLFPAEEILAVIRDRFKLWTSEENIIILNIINQCIDDDLLDTVRNQNDYLQEYKRFEYNLIVDMILSNVKMSAKEMDALWDRFWNFNMLNEIYNV
jgi:hypothetical protein